PVIDDDRLPQRLVDSLPHLARDEVRSTARRIRNDEADRTVRIRPGGRGWSKEQRGKSDECRYEAPPACITPHHSSPIAHPALLPADVLVEEVHRARPGELGGRLVVARGRVVVEPVLGARIDVRLVA